MNTHYEFKYGFEENGQSMCSINEKLNCESVSISPYSYFAGLPLATWGMAFHLAFLFLFALLFTQPNKSASISRFIKFFSSLSLAATLVMATVAFTMMNAYCIFCMTLYVLSIANFIVLAKYKEISFLPTKEDIQRLFKTGENGLIYILFAFIGIPAVAFLGHDMGSRSFIQKSAFMINDSLSEWERAPLETFGTPMLVEGSKSPKVTIVEFADFECIHCKDAVYNLHSFVNSKPDVQLQFYSFPLDGTCNPALGPGGNGKRCVLAKATYCAEKQGKGWQAHGWIFDRFGTDENSAFESMSKDLGLDYNALNTCIQSEEASEFIATQAKLGQKVKVEGTPTIFINGKRLPGGNIVAILEAIYKKLNP